MATLEELQKQIADTQKKVDSQRYFGYRHHGGSDNDYKYTANFDFEQAVKTGEKKDGGQYQSLTGTVGNSSKNFRREHYGGVFDALGKYAATKSELARLQKQYADMQKKPDLSSIAPDTNPDRPFTEQPQQPSKTGPVFDNPDLLRGTDMDPDQPFTIAPQVVVYGPDGTSYPNPQAAIAAGVTNYTMTPPDLSKDRGLVENPGSKYMGGFRQPGDAGRYVAFNDPGQPGEGFANAEEYEGALKQGKKIMAATDTPLKGKTGEELEKAVLQRQAEQADSQAMTPGTTIDPELQEVQDEELLTDSNVKMATVTAPVPATIDPALYNQTAPVATAAKTYEAANVIQPTDAQAARGQVSAEAIIQAQQGALSADSLAAAQTETLDPRATTQFQLAELFKSLEDGKPLPAWAAPAVRNVTAIMQQRGLGSSSMAAAATMQALMESGVNIANQDAQKYATIQLQNLNNKQQAELQNATALANMDMANLNNRQQAAVNNAKTFLAIDVQNLTNEQQSKTIDYQAKVNMMLSDQAAKNAASQFNAKSDNEINMFFEELGSQIESASKNRAVSVAQFNVNQRTAMDQFNASMSASREQFNSNMQSTINQSNANWRRQLNTANTASQNAANQQNAQNLLTLNQNSLNNLWQLYRDQAAWTMQISENNSERAHNAAMLSAQIDANSSSYDDQFNNFLMVKTVDSIFKSL